MRQQEQERTGWEFVADTDGAAALIDAALGLEDDRVTRTELARRADLSLKELYLDGTVTDLVEAGIFERVDEVDGEPVYETRADSDILEAARRFDRSLAAELD